MKSVVNEAGVAAVKCRYQDKFLSLPLFPATALKTTSRTVIPGALLRGLGTVDMRQFASWMQTHSVPKTHLSALGTRISVDSVRAFTGSTKKLEDQNWWWS